GQQERPRRQARLAIQGGLPIVDHPGLLSRWPAIGAALVSWSRTRRTVRRRAVALLETSAGHASPAPIRLSWYEGLSPGVAPTKRGPSSGGVKSRHLIAVAQVTDALAHIRVHRPVLMREAPR